MARLVVFVPSFMVLLQVQGQLLSPQDCLPSAPHEDALLANTNISVDELSSLSARSIGRQNNGLLIIIPDRTFSCYGFVSSWTGILSMEAASVPLSQELVIYLQVWRPLDNGAFDLVGSKSLVLNTMTFCETLSTTDIYLGVAGDTHYRTFTGSEEEGTSGGVAFQPGDVIGCFIPGVPATNGSSSTASLGLAVRNGSGHRSDREVDLLVYPVDGDICEAAVACEGTQVIISSVQPQIYPHQWFSGDFGSGSGQPRVACSNVVPRDCLTPPTDCGGESSCGSEKDSGTVSGLFIVIAAVCISAVCLIGLTANFVTFCIARRSFKRTNRTRVLLRTSNRVEANCPFIISQQVEESNQQRAGETAEGTNDYSALDLTSPTSLEEFFEMQYQSEPNRESNRISWV